MTNIIGHFKASELIYMFVGTLFLLNALVLSMDGGYSLLITTKIAYLIGFVFLIIGK